MSKDNLQTWKELAITYGFAILLNAVPLLGFSRELSQFKGAWVAVLLLFVLQGIFSYSVAKSHTDPNKEWSRYALLASAVVQAIVIMSIGAYYRWN